MLYVASSCLLGTSSTVHVQAGWQGTRSSLSVRSLPLMRDLNIQQVQPAARHVAEVTHMSVTNKSLSIQQRSVLCISRSVLHEFEIAIVCEVIFLRY